MSERVLSAREQAFVDAYVGPSGGVGTDACRRAGYEGTDKTLATQASRLLNRPQVKAALEQRQALAFAETERIIAEGAAEVGRQNAEAILSAQECALILSGIATGTLEEPQFEGGMGPAKHKERIAAIKVLGDLCGYKAPTKTEVSGAVAIDLAMSPDTEAALDDWLLVRNDPRVKAVIAEMRGET